jgi:hypothetical protein
MMPVIKYREGYKFQLAETYSLRICIPGYDIATEFISLNCEGVLTIKSGYAWDGCSGPAWNDRTNMRGGLVHDALYQLMRMGLITDNLRCVADHMLREICIQDGMGKLRAWYYFAGVDHLAKGAAKKGANPYPILTAP